MLQSELRPEVLRNPTHRHPDFLPSAKSRSVKMPSEVTDIKQFLEIARRKDAKGTFFLRPGLYNRLFTNVEMRRDGPFGAKKIVIANESVCSRRSSEEILQEQGHQVEDPMQAILVHPDPQGLGQGGQD